MDREIGAARSGIAGHHGEVDREDLRLAVYRSFAESGRAPAPGELASQFGTDVPAVSRGLKELAASRDIVLDGQGRIVMAHPFSAIPLGFSVMGARVLWWGGCAWDSFALPHLLPGEGEMLVATRCPACRRPHAWNVGTGGPPVGGQVAHFLVPAARMWDDVMYTCGHQSLFCSVDCVTAWLEETGLPRGYVMDLGTLWRLAAHWYEGRLERGYTRRDLARAADYLRSAGLSGPFWGL